MTNGTRTGTPITNTKGRNHNFTTTCTDGNTWANKWKTLLMGSCNSEKEAYRIKKVFRWMKIWIWNKMNTAVRTSWFSKKARGDGGTSSGQGSVSIGLHIIVDFGLPADSLQGGLKLIKWQKPSGKVKPAVLRGCFVEVRLNRHIHDLCVSLYRTFRDVGHHSRRERFSSEAIAGGHVQRNRIVCSWWWEQPDLANRTLEGAIPLLIFCKQTVSY